MTLFDALLLGIIQGLTEFVPVSSTAHLLIGQTLLGIKADDAMFSYLVIVQLGTLVSLFIFYWHDLLRIIAQSLQAVRILLTRRRAEWRFTPDQRLGWHLILATIPALLFGYLLKDAVEALFRIPLLEAAIRLFTAAVLLTLAEMLSPRKRSLDTLTWVDALAIGAMQVIAVFPGASRSGTTISGGMFRGFDRPAAARFAFLMSIPVMLAAGGYEMLDVIRMPGLTGFLPLLGVGFAAAALAGWFAIRWLIAFLGRRSLSPFAAYCALAGTACLAAWLF